jgi:hypothetical protein
MSDDATKREKDLQGIRGWLLLVAVSVVTAPIMAGVTIAMVFPLLSSLSDLISYNSTAGFLVIFSAIGQVLFLLMGIFAIFKFFKKQKVFPKLFIALLATGIVLGAADLAILNLLSPGETIEHSKNAARLGVQGFWSLVWSTYMFKSKRVKATFIA